MKSGSIANTGQLTINTKDINAGNYQIFTGVGNIDFAPGSMVKSKWFNNFETALALTVNDTVTLKVTDSATLTSSFALGDNVSLNWDSPGNVLTANAGVTISNLRDIDAGEYLIFTGAGNFRFRDGTKLKLSWFNHFRSAITYISTSKVTLVSSIPSTVDFSDTVPENVSIYVNNGGLVTVSTGITLTINGSFDAGDYQAFSCAGTGAVANLKHTSPTWFGLSSTATGANNQIYLTKAIASIVAGGEVNLSFGSYAVVGNWILNKSATINFNNATLNFSTDAVDQGILVTANNVQFKDPIITGPQFALARAAQCGIKAYGIDNFATLAAPTYISGLKIIGGRITNWGRAGIEMQFVEDFEISGVSIENVYYYGIAGSSVKNGRIHHNEIRNITGTTAGTIYGNILTVDSHAGSTAVTDPASRDVLVDHNYIYNIPTWQGLDTHGGVNITFNENVIIDCKWGINASSYTSSFGIDYPVENTVITGNTIITTVAAPSYGIAVSGSGTAINLRGMIANNIIRGHGNGVYVVNHSNAVITGNNISDFSVSGIYLYHDFADVNVTNNTIGLARVGATGYPIYIGTAASHTSNTGLIANNVVNATGVDYGIYNAATGWTDTHLKANRVTGATIAPYYMHQRMNFDMYVDNTDKSTSGLGEDTLATLLLNRYMFADRKGIRLTASGIKTGSGGNKSIRVYLGSSYFIFNVAANDTNDWRVVAEILFTASNAQKVTWQGWNGATPLQGYEDWTEDIGAGSLSIKLTGICLDAGDVITEKTFSLERLEW